MNIKVKRYAILIASAILALVGFYVLPITLANLSTTNMLINGALFVFAIAGIYLFFKSLRVEMKSNELPQDLIPIDDDM